MIYDFTGYRALNYTHASVLKLADTENINDLRLIELVFCGLG